jgi:hypothetical protein
MRKRRTPSRFAILTWVELLVQKCFQKDPSGNLVGRGGVGLATHLEPRVGQPLQSAVDDGTIQIHRHLGVIELTNAIHEVYFEARVQNVVPAADVGPPMAGAQPNVASNPTMFGLKRSSDTVPPKHSLTGSVRASSGQVMGARISPKVVCPRNPTRNALPRGYVQLRANPNRFAVTPFIVIGGTQLPSMAKCPGRVSPTRGRGNASRRLAFSGSLPGRQ